MEAASCEDGAQRYHESQHQYCWWPLSKSPVLKKTNIKKKKMWNLVQPGSYPI